jgi:hypothetical protein
VCHFAFYLLPSANYFILTHKIMTMITKHPPLRLAWTIWGFGATFYLMGFFQRVAPAVMTGELMQAFDLNATAFGNLSAFYFYSYVSMQIPTGILADLWGPRRLCTDARLGPGVSGIAVFHQGNPLPTDGAQLIWSQRPPAKRVAWISGHRPERQKHVSALIVAVVTGCIAPGLKTTNQLGVIRYLLLVIRIHACRVA